MAEENNEINSVPNDVEKAQPFFDRGEQVAATDNFDYAIDMYIEGLKRAPDALDEGHKPLRHNALIRQAKGGKKPSMIEKMKKGKSKVAIDSMLNAEYLLAKDPDNLAFAEQMLRAAVKAKCNKTANWIADLLFEANRGSDKPSFATYMLLKDSYSALEKYAKAVSACSYAAQMKPDDGALADEVKNLSANMVVQKGNYENADNFRDSIQDKESQDLLQAQTGSMKSVDFRMQQIEDARKLLEADDSQKNVLRLADKLSEVQSEPLDKEAVDLLNKYYESTRDFTYKRRSGEILLKALRRRVQKAKLAVEADTGSDEAKDRLKKAIKQLFLAEMEHYRLSVEQYPTDLKLKYEYGVRLMRNGKYDQAIPFLQDSRREPRHKITAASKIGLCFFMKGWFNDAIDTFKEAYDACEIKDNAVAKELQYNLARAYEKNGDSNDSLEIYRRLAQLDFGYKDVRARIDRLRQGQ